MNKFTAKQELWKRGVLHWKLHSTQITIYNAIKGLPVETREALVFCSRRLGKSFLGVLMALEDCLQNDNVEVAIIAPNLKQGRAIITPLINAITVDAPAGLIKQTKSELLWRVGNSNLVIQAFDTAAESIRGRAFHNIYLEESGSAGLNEFEYVLNSILKPTLMHSRGRIVHLTTPAVEVNHPLHTITLPGCASSGALFRYTIRDNPLLTSEVIEKEIESLGGEDSITVRRELFCEIAKDNSTLVVPEYSRECVKKLVLPPFYHALTSIDFGGAQDKHGVVVCYYDFKRAKFCVYREALLDKNTPTSQIKIATQTLEKQLQWNGKEPNRLGDAPGQLRVDLANDNFYCRMPTKEAGSVEANINNIRLAFQRGDIEIDESCTLLQATLEFGSWQTNRKDWQRTAELGHLDLLAAILYSYRHIDKSNPYPKYYGVNVQNTYPIEREEQSSQQAIRQLFLS